MMTSHHDRQANARRVQASQTDRARLADQFRRRYLDGAIKRLLAVTPPVDPIRDNEHPPA